MKTHFDLLKLLEEVRDLSSQEYDISLLQASCEKFYLDEKTLKDHSDHDIYNFKGDSSELADHITINIFKKYANTIKNISPGIRKQVLSKMNFRISHKIDEIKRRRAKT
jgi:hypothetical protein